MIVIMHSTASARQISEVIARIRAMGYDVHLSEGEDRTIIGVIGQGRALDREQLSTMAGVEDVLRVTHPYKIASRHYHPDNTVFPLGNTQVGSNDLTIIAGPCSVEGRSELLEVAHMVKEAGATALRGGAFKPRTSPYSFQGLGEEGLKYLAEAREQTGLPVVTEVMDPSLVPLVTQYADVLQIGARNMQNYTLLHAAGESMHPVLLKRGMSSTLDELLQAAEYILSHGNMRVMVCERGIRTFGKETRNTFDLNAIVALKQLTHLPVIADPSHATGKWEYVEGVALGAIAAGADGVIVEVHQQPDVALSDGRQSLKPAKYTAMLDKIRGLATVLGRNVPEAQPVLT
jgi:3-deoxy-7-phosphoheptulonate synthase